MSLDYSVICIVCLETGQLKSIYEKDGKDIQVFTKLSSCSGVNLNLFKCDYPKQICSKCMDALEQSFEFLVKCRKTFAILKNCLTNKSSTTMTILPENEDIPLESADNELIEDLCEYLNIPRLTEESSEIFLDNVNFLDFSSEDQCGTTNLVSVTFYLILF